MHLKMIWREKVKTVEHLVPSVIVWHEPTIIYYITRGEQQRFQKSAKLAARAKRGDIALVRSRCFSPCDVYIFSQRKSNFRYRCYQIFFFAIICTYELSVPSKFTLKMRKKKLKIDHMVAVRKICHTKRRQLLYCFFFTYFQKSIN